MGTFSGHSKLVRPAIFLFMQLGCQCSQLPMTAPAVLGCLHRRVQADPLWTLPPCLFCHTFSADGLPVLTTSCDKTAKVWDASTVSTHKKRDIAAGSALPYFLQMGCQCS